MNRATYNSPGSPASGLQDPLPLDSLKKKRKDMQLVLVNTDLRRSLRLKAHNSGFKPSGRGKNQCLGCDLDPPFSL
jgi:hypothetical protein